MERPYVYQALTPPHSIRLLRLLPDTNADGPLHGSLFECNIEVFYGHSNAYEALSYVWGDPTLSHSISIDGFKLPITANLHTALANLRSPYIERLLWVDAMCIDQTNDREKEWQIGLMYQIYACASCVVVWLGEHEDESEHICEDLLFIRQKKPNLYQVRAFLSDRIIKFFQRAWFRRVWGLQEVGAARRIQIRWGNSTMDGFTFSAAANLVLLRLQQVGEAHKNSQNMQSVARFIPYLIQGSPFRLPYQGRNGPPDGVCSFTELVDMFHKGEASKMQDKVYALLAMSTENMGASGLSPDYTIPFGKLFEKVISTVISDKMSVNCQDSIDAAVIKTTGYVLATVQKVRDDLRDTQLQWIDISLCSFDDSDTCSHTSLESSADDGGENKQSLFQDDWYIQASAISLRKGDLICYFNGATRPSIIRVCQDYSIIIVAAVRRNKIEMSDSEERLAWQKRIDDESLPKRGFSLVWDWSYSFGSHSETYAAWAQSRAWVSDSTSATQNKIDDLVCRYDCALIYTDANGIEALEDRLKEVLIGFEAVLQSEESHTRSREVFSAFLLRLYGGDSTMPGHAPNEDYREKGPVLEYISGLFRLAAEECCKNLTRLLFETLEVHEPHTDRDFRISRVARAGLLDLVELLLEENTYTRGEVWVALKSAATGGHLAVIEYLLEAAHAKGLEIAPAIDSALASAAERGHLAVFERLLQAGANANARGTGGRSIISLEAAAQGGNLAIFGRLLQVKSHESQVRSPDGLYAALQAAAGAGHCSIVELLIQAGADVNNGSPLMRAATGGHLSTVERLIQAGANVNVNGYYDKSMLAEVATIGHFPVVKRLIQAGAEINSLGPMSPSHKGPTPLIAASIAGHFSIVAWLLEAGADPAITYIIRSLQGFFRPALSPQPKAVARTAHDLALKYGHYAVAEILYEVSAAHNDNQHRSRMKLTHSTWSNEESRSGDES